MLDNEMGREEIGRAIKRVIIDKEGTEMRQQSKSLQEMVNRSLEKGGSANQSLESLPIYLGFGPIYVTDVWRIGVMLDNEMGREEIGRAIKRVIIDKEGTEMRQQSKSLQEMVNRSLEKGGSANQSLESLVDCILSF
nr:UDP-glycosyltransferase 76B1-like [Tanacetum cinerariifolium]